MMHDSLPSNAWSELKLRYWDFILELAEIVSKLLLKFKWLFYINGTIDWKNTIFNTYKK